MLKSSKRDYVQASKRARNAYELIRKRDQVGSDSTEGMQLDITLRRSVKPGYYEHFKSSKDKRMFYRVFEIISHVNYTLDSHAYQVCYAAQYAPHTGKKAGRELLGEDGFLTPIKRDGYIGPRFKYVGKTLTEAKRKSAYQ